MSERAQRHLVAVWNPSYAVDAMEATVSLLLKFARDARAGLSDDEDVYVWWGKVRSSNRQAPLPHLKDVLALDEDLSDAESLKSEMHLYLTDYRSLYVGHIAQITSDDVTQMHDEMDHVPRFYLGGKLACDCWFQLYDIRRIASDDTKVVISELKKLRNTRYHGRPVSIYGGMVDLPLIVTRQDGARFFEADVRERLTEGRYWVEFDAEHSGVGQMEQELRDNLFGEAIWSTLDPLTRGFIATGEQIYRMHRYDIAFDFAPMAVEFAKAFELQTNSILRRALRDVSSRERFINIDGQTRDVCCGELWSLTELSRIIGQEETINKLLKKRLASNSEWFTASLPAILAELATLRNPAAHSQAVSKDAATSLRNRLVGIGMPGALVELGRVRLVVSE